MFFDSAASQGNLANNPNCGWRPSSTGTAGDMSQYIEYTFDQAMFFTAVKARGGRNCGSNYVSSFVLSYNYNGGWVMYTHNDVSMQMFITYINYNNLTEM